MALPVLYSFRRCPYAMRARMALLISGTACELREVTLADKPEAMITASTKGTVPVLVLPNGTAMDESIDIMGWALRRNDPENWLAGQEPALVVANDGPFKHHLDRYKYASRHDGDALGHRTAALELLSHLEPRLAGRRNLTGEQRAFADVAIMPFVRQFADTDPAFFESQPLPALQRWLTSHLDSQLFAEAMARSKPWSPGDATVLLQPGARRPDHTAIAPTE